MKKTISTLILILTFAVAILADDPIVPPNPNCTRGHINTPIFVCEPPSQPREINGETGNGSVSIFTVVSNWVAEFNPAAYF